MFTADDHARIRAAIHDAETRTSGEILCMVTRERHNYPAFSLGTAAFLAFTLPFVSTLLGFGPDAWWGAVAGWAAPEPSVLHLIEAYAVVQLLIFLGTAALLLFTPLGQRLAPQRLKQERVHDLAMHHFLAQGIHVTEGRTGVLIFASVTDHVAEVVADRAIYEKVPPEHWGDTLAPLLQSFREGRPGDGFVAAVGMAGAVLAEHFPPTAENPNELDNTLIEV